MLHMHLSWLVELRQGRCMAWLVFDRCGEGWQLTLFARQHLIETGEPAAMATRAVDGCGAVSVLVGHDRTLVHYRPEVLTVAAATAAGGFIKRFGGDRIQLEERPTLGVTRLFGSATAVAALLAAALAGTCGKSEACRARV